MKVLPESVMDTSLSNKERTKRRGNGDFTPTICDENNFLFLQHRLLTNPYSSSTLEDYVCHFVRAIPRRTSSHSWHTGGTNGESTGFLDY
jgi:hypothetical protein